MHNTMVNTECGMSVLSLLSLLRIASPLPTPFHEHRRSRILDIKTLEEDPGAAQEFARSKASARKEGLTGVEFKDIAGLDPILGEVLEVSGALRDVLIIYLCEVFQ